MPQTHSPNDSLGWRPRPQSPAESYTSFRQLRDLAKVRPDISVPPQATTPTEAARAATKPEPVVAAPARRRSWLFGRKHSKPQPERGRVIITDYTLTAVRIAPDPGKTEKTKHEGPTPQQRISAIITGIVGLVAVIALVAQPFLHAHASPEGITIPGESGMYPLPTSTSTPYAPVTLDTDHPPPVVWAEAAFVMDESNGAVLYAKNPNEELPMASTTKLMTAVVAVQHGDLDQTITINADAANTFCTCVYLKVGEQYTLRELLTSMLQISGNDAAEAIADGVAGNVQTFVGWMNQTAAALGLTRTHYTNPHGLDDNGHYSSARDLAVLGRYALSIPIIQQAVTMRTYNMPKTATHAAHNLVNQHQPLWWYPGADGGKPGWTPAAQFVDILSAVRNGHRIIATLLHGANDWVTDIRDLLNWGFNNFTWVSPLQTLQNHGYIPFADAYSDFTWDVPSRTLTVNGKEYFPYTGFFIADPFLTYFNNQPNGGINGFGFPRGEPIPNANGTLSQRFDKVTISCTPSTGACSTAANH